MSRSPLEAVAVFQIGPVVITGTVVTTWALIVALVIASRYATRRLQLIPDGLQAIELGQSTPKEVVSNVSKQLQSWLDQNNKK